METFAEILANLPSPEEFWASLIRSHEEWEQRQKKLDADFVKSHEEWEQRQKEWEQRQKKLDAKIAAMSNNIGGLNRSIGELVETLIAARLWEKFPEYNLQRAYRRLPIYNEKNELKSEIDILLVNTEWAMAVEVKREADTQDIAYHIERMARILKYPPAQLSPDVKLLGAMAGGIVTQGAREAAHKAGFYVLELAGESVIRLPEPPDFKPKEW
jgi:predicted AAA+ superfamily ATPase